MNRPCPVAPGLELADGVRLDALLGRGGLCEVWRATTRGNEVVALKIPRTDRLPSSAVELIRREYRVLGSLSHPNILVPLGLIAVAETPALMTEYLGGGDLVPLLGSAPRHWVGAAGDLARALVHVHERGLVHRDVKSCNFLFSAAGDAKLVDFALAVEVGAEGPRSGGTLAYERLARRQGTRPEVADDVYAFSVMLYELLAGRLPFGVNPTVAMLQAEPSPPLASPRDAGAGAEALAELVVATLSYGKGPAPGSVRPFLDVLESMSLEYE